MRTSSRRGLGNRFGDNNVNRLRWACCKCVASTGELHKPEHGFAGSVILMSFSSWSATGGEGGTLRHFDTIRLFSWKNQQIRRFRGIHSGLHFKSATRIRGSMQTMWSGLFVSARLAFTSSLIRQRHGPLGRPPGRLGGARALVRQSLFVRPWRLPEPGRDRGARAGHPLSDETNQLTINRAVRWRCLR
jgi:hypothetical protein